MRIFYLYTELTPYITRVFQEIRRQSDAELYVVYWDKGGNTPYRPENIEGVSYFKRSEHDSSAISNLVLDTSPDLIYVTAWQDKTYLKACVKARQKKIPVLAGFDDIWENSLRQVVGSYAAKFLRKRYFSHAWVSGPRQFEYAKKFGFANEEIVYYLFSGNFDLFNKAAETNQEKRDNYPTRFLFVGRFAPAKAVDVLTEAYRIYRANGGLWDLACAGNGPQREVLKSQPGIEVLDFLAQDDMPGEIARSGAFVLPSRRDVSPLVVHEFAAAGMPLILSRNIGNRPMFLIEGFNGFSFQRESASDLAAKMSLMSRLTSDELVDMSEASRLLASQHRPEFVAASLLSVLHL